MSNAFSFKGTAFRGFLVLLPLVVLTILFMWVYNIFAGMLSPLIRLIGAQPGIIANFIVVAAMIVISFLLGTLITTNTGKIIIHFMERNTLYFIPGYATTKSILHQLLDVKAKKSTFLSVALVNLFQTDTLVTGFITEEHDNGMVTVFVPTGPNPTSGNIYHLKKKYIHKLDIPVETAIRSIIVGGKGSKPLVEEYMREMKKRRK